MAYYWRHTLTGTLELKLNKMLKPAKKASGCSLDQLQLAPSDDVTAQKPPKPVKPGDVFSLFEARRIKGFWPVYNDATGENVLTVHAVMTFFQFSRRFKYFFFFSAG